MASPTHSMFGVERSFLTNKRGLLAIGFGNCSRALYLASVYLTGVGRFQLEYVVRLDLDV